MAASRAYYAMFYLAQAVLLSDGMAFSKHSAAIGAFGEHFVKPGHLAASLQRCCARPSMSETLATMISASPIRAKGRNRC